MNAIVALNQYTAGPFGLCATLMSVFPAKVLLFEEFESRLFITLSLPLSSLWLRYVYIYIYIYTNVGLIPSETSVRQMFVYAFIATLKVFPRA